MKNLIKKIKSESRKQETEFINELNSLDSIEKTLEVWRYRNLLTVTTGKKEWKDLQELKVYLLKRFLKRSDKNLSEELERIEAIEKAGDFKKITINIEWKRSRMWGSNPTASSILITTDQTLETAESGSVGGSGYDKESTAIANVLNQYNSVLKKLFEVKAEKPTKENRDLLGYGSGYGLLPYIDGGVGVSCYYKIFEKIGCTFEKISGGKTFDVYQIINNRAK